MAGIIISYVPGMGSFLRLIAFYTDYVCDENSWQEAVMMKICEKCFLCRERCPTGCIPDGQSSNSRGKLPKLILMKRMKIYTAG